MVCRDYNQQFQKKPKNGKLVVIVIAVLIAVLFTTVFFAQSSEDNQGYRTISVVEVSGNVSVVKDGIEYRAYPGMLLQEGHELITSSNSFVRLVLDDDKYVKLESGSRVVFETLGLLGSGKTHIRIERGSLTTEITKPLNEDEEFIVNAPNAVLAVRGTFFRVEVALSSKGEVRSDVMTYGGKVASQRILPTGEKVEEEVVIEAGFKTTINMTEEDTHYVVEDEAGEGLQPTQPITIDDITTEDLIDVYFAAENGHDLFVTAEEAKTDLESRDVVIEEQTSIYEKAEEIQKALEVTVTPNNGVSNTTSALIKADDSQPIAKAEEVKPEENTSIDTSNNGSASNGNTGATGLVDGEHVHREKKTTIEATCSTPGSIVITCRDCKETLRVKEIPQGGHVFDEWVVTQEATCTTTGSQTHRCNICGEEETASIAELGHIEAAGASKDIHGYCSTCGIILSTTHEMVHTAYVAPGCMTEGTNTYTCDCGYGYTEELSALGHVVVVGGTENAHSKCSNCGEILSAEHSMVQTEDKAPTCTTTGRKTFACDCGYTYSNETAALGHTEVKAGTEGAHLKCSVCNTVLSKEHNYKENIISSPGCTTTGEKEYTCDCGYKYTEILSALGHSEVIYGTEKVHSVCSICEEILSTEHKMVQTAGKPATCTQKGKNTYTCDCGYTYSVETEAFGHTEVNGGNYDRHKYCITCGETTEENHNFTVERQEPTCKDIGLINYTCDCGYAYSDIIDKLPHTEMKGGTEDAHSKCSVCGEVLSAAHNVVNTGYVAPSCTQPGSDTYTCDCGYTYTNEVPALNHTETDGATSNIHTYCSVCNEVLSSTHSYTETETKAAGCEEPGTMTHSCDCGYSYTTEIEALSHNYVVKEEVGEDGFTTSYEKCENCGDVIYEYTYLALNSTNFPDAEFLAYLEDEYNIDGNPGLTSAEISNITSLVLNGNGAQGEITSDGNISNLKGVEYLTALETLNVGHNANLTSLDVSQNTNLTALVASGSGITSIDISGCERLELLYLDYCEGLAMLDITSNYNLTELDIYYSGVTSLISDVSANYGLTKLNICGTKISTFDFSDFHSVQELRVDANLQTLDLTDCVEITDLYIEAGTMLSTLDVSGKTNLRNIVFEGTNSITEIRATDMWLNSTLDLSKCPSLVTLDTSRTSISDLDFSQNNAIESISIAGNSSIAILDLSNKSNLRQLDVSNCSMLQFLNVANCTDMTSLNITGTDNISSFNVTGAGSPSSVFTFTVTASDTYDTNMIEGWDDTYMVMTPAP